MRETSIVKRITIGASTIYIHKISNGRNTRFAVTENPELRLTKKSNDITIFRKRAKAEKEFSFQLNMLNEASKAAYYQSLDY